MRRGRQERTWGYATLIRATLRQRLRLADPVFVAVFTEGRTILVRLGERVFDLANEAIAVRDRGVGPLRRRFSVFVNGVSVSDVAYDPFSVDYDSFTGAESIFDRIREAGQVSQHRSDGVCVDGRCSRGMERQPGV